MDKIVEDFLNIKYEGSRFSKGRLPLDVLADLQALEDILTSFAREIWLEENDRERMPTGYADWFNIALVGVGEGSALPKLQLQINEPEAHLIEDHSRHKLMHRAEERFAKVLEAAEHGQDVALSPTQIRNFNRFLTNLKPGELFKYKKGPGDDFTADNVISLDVERRKRFLTSVTTSYEQRIQGRGRLKSVDENGYLKFVSHSFKEFSVLDNSQEPTIYGSNIGSYYEFDLTVERRHDDIIQSVITIHDLSLLEDPAITAIDQMAALEDGWLDGYGSAVSERVREQAKSFLISFNRLPSFYAVAPTEEGGILLEYINNGWDYGIEFNADLSSCVFGIKVGEKEEFSEEFSAAQSKKFASRVKATLGHQ